MARARFWVVNESYLDNYSLSEKIENIPGIVSPRRVDCTMFRLKRTSMKKDFVEKCFSIFRTPFLAQILLSHQPLLTPVQKKHIRLTPRPKNKNVSKHHTSMIHNDITCLDAFFGYIRRPERKSRNFKWSYPFFFPVGQNGVTPFFSTSHMRVSGGRS